MSFRKPSSAVCPKAAEKLSLKELSNYNCLSSIPSTFLISSNFNEKLLTDFSICNLISYNKDLYLTYPREEDIHPEILN